MFDNQISVFGDCCDDQLRADVIAARYGLPRDNQEAGIRLIVSASGLSLRVMRGELSGGKPVLCDWSKCDTASSSGARLSQPIYKAIGLRKGDAHRPHVIDATAGFGEDAYLLASAGCSVTAIERCAPLAAMLEDAAERFAVSIDVICGDSISLLGDLRKQNFRGLLGVRGRGVVYLDPMFPGDRKALQRKPMRVLRALVGEDCDTDQLFAAALQAATGRVVVKRPLRAAPLGGHKPKVSHKGQAVRYDVYIPDEIL